MNVKVLKAEGKKKGLFMNYFISDAPGDLFY